MTGILFDGLIFQYTIKIYWLDFYRAPKWPLLLCTCSRKSVHAYIRGVYWYSCWCLSVFLSILFVLTALSYWDTFDNCLQPSRIEILQAFSGFCYEWNIIDLLANRYLWNEQEFPADTLSPEYRLSIVWLNWVSITE